MNFLKPEKVVFPLFEVHDVPAISLSQLTERRFDLLERYNSQETCMLDRNDGRTITALVDEVLKALRTNLEEHIEIVQEARDGYIDKAQAVLNKRLDELREGKLVSLSFKLAPPQDHSKDFRTAIKMMEMHAASFEADLGNKGHHATFELKAADVQRFVLNDWSWMDSFLDSTALYSGKAAKLFAARS